MPLHLLPATVNNLPNLIKLEFSFLEDDAVHELAYATGLTPIILSTRVTATWVMEHLIVILEVVILQKDA